MLQWIFNIWFENFEHVKYHSYCTTLIIITSVFHCSQPQIVYSTVKHCLVKNLTHEATLEHNHSQYFLHKLHTFVFCTWIIFLYFFKREEKKNMKMLLPLILESINKYAISDKMIILMHAGVKKFTSQWKLIFFQCISFINGLNSNKSQTDLSGKPIVFRWSSLKMFASPYTMKSIICFMNIKVGKYSGSLI